MTETHLLRFNRRPSPVLPDHRPLYKIGQLLLILRIASRGGKSSSARLQLFNWALKNKDRSAQLAKASAARALAIVAWGFDPALAIALRFAEAEGLVKAHPRGYELTERGAALADE